MSRAQRIQRSKHPPTSKTRSEETSDDSRDGQEVEAHVQVASEPSASETEAVLDEINRVLESNAEEFVKGYVQKGGQ